MCMLRVRRVSRAAWRLRAQRGCPHEPFHTLPPTADALRPQFGMHTWATLRGAAAAVDGTNLPLIGLVPLAPRSPLRRIETGTRHTQQTAHQRYRKMLSLGLDAGVGHRDSLAKYAAAFLESRAPVCVGRLRGGGGVLRRPGWVSAHGPQRQPQQQSSRGLRLAASNSAACWDEPPGRGRPVPVACHVPSHVGPLLR